MLSKQMSPVDWSESAKAVHNKIRGLYSWPGATCVLDGKTVKLHASVLSDYTGGEKNGEVVRSDGILTVRCGDGKCIDITELQLEGKKRMDAQTFLNGRKIPAGTVLG
ncbi:MAG: methionyl-tRNA formyltransferase, partial [Clostridia bacterium]|nr:methionyl-tRNA formyltransferase [Clostridia bacterium]